MKLVVLLAVLGLAASGQALKCYTCRSKTSIAGVSLGTLQSMLDGAPLCSEFDASNPDAKKFLKECPAAGNKACMKITDKKDSTNEIRGCYLKKMDECKQGSCYCTEDACNGAGRGWPSVVLLLVAALAAALFGAR